MKLLHPKSLRGKISFMLIAALIAAMAIVALISTFALQAVLQDAVSDSLTERLNEAEKEVEEGHYQHAIDRAGHDVIQLVEEGQVIMASPNARGEEPLTQSEDPDSYRVQDDEPRLIMKRTVESPDGPVTIEAEASLERSLADARRAGLLLFLTMANILLVAFIISRRVFDSALEPVEEMRKQVENIDAKNLDERIAISEDDPDLGALAKTFNSLLDQVSGYANAYKRFLADSSHELKSPITAIGVAVEAMREHPDEIDTAQGLADIANENARMQRIVNNLLLMARSDEGQLTADMRPIDLMDLILEEISPTRYPTHLAIDTSGVQPIVCTGDATMLEHAVRNLVDNAAQYARSRIRISCTADNQLVRIVVSDDGPGIPEEYREKVFERFARVEEGGSPAARRSSTGLGLPVVKSIAEKHNGRIYFGEPELGGATAILEIPA